MKLSQLWKKLCLTLLTMLLATPAFASTKVKIETNQGDIIVQLNSEKAPHTVANFLKYVQDGSYKDSIFHRVIKDFMIQGGGFGIDKSKLATYAPVVNESKNGLQNKRGSIAMARTNYPNSATRQFFINHKDNSFLNGTGSNWGYTVFGQVVTGMEVVDAIANTATGRDPKMNMKDVPKSPMVIKSISIYEPEPDTSKETEVQTQVETTEKPAEAEAETLNSEK